MSVWYEIENSDDLDVSSDGEDLHILFDSDDQGNKYVSVPVGMVEAMFYAEVPAWILDAIDRLIAGEAEQDVMADYGYRYQDR